MNFSQIYFFGSNKTEVSPNIPIAPIFSNNQYWFDFGDASTQLRDTTGGYTSIREIQNKNTGATFAKSNLKAYDPLVLTRNDFECARNGTYGAGSDGSVNLYTNAFTQSQEYTILAITGTHSGSVGVMYIDNSDGSADMIPDSGAIRHMQFRYFNSSGVKVQIIPFNTAGTNGLAQMAAPTASINFICVRVGITASINLIELFVNSSTPSATSSLSGTLQSTNSLSNIIGSKSLGSQGNLYVPVFETFRYSRRLTNDEILQYYNYYQEKYLGL